jgi:hypothetical protein
MELLISIITFLVGCGLTWWLAHRSSSELKLANAELRADNAKVHAANEELRRLIGDVRRDNAELKALLEKLPVDLTDAVARDPRTTLTIQQIGDLTRVVSGLQTRNQPRTLNEENTSKLIELLGNIEPSPVLVSAMSNDTEAQHYRDRIGKVFEAAGWPTSIRNAIAGADVSDVTLYYDTGPSSYPHVIPSPPSNAVEIATAFAAVGIALPVEALAEFTPHDHRLHLAVGQKPTL